MQVLERHKRVFLIVILLAVVLILSLFIIQYLSNPSLTHISSPSPTASPVPTRISPKPTVINSPTPSAQYTSTPSQMPTLTPTPVPSLYPGEVTQYQNQSLTPINGFISEFLSTSIAGAQYVNLTTYRLIVTGLVNQTQEYTYDDVVNKFSARQQVVTLLCVAGWGADVLWKGVSVNDILQASGVSPQADTLIFYASDGYSTSLPLSYVVENNLMLAYKMNNVTLTPQTGFPFMLVAQNQYGYKWIKWVTEIDVSNNANYLGYWESRGYPNDATISNPSSLMPNTAGSTAVISVLYGGGTIMAGATYFTLTNLNNKRSKFQKNNDKAD